MSYHQLTGYICTVLSFPYHSSVVQVHRSLSRRVSSLAVARRTQVRYYHRVCALSSSFTQKSYAGCKSIGRAANLSEGRPRGSPVQRLREGRERYRRIFVRATLAVALLGGDWPFWEATGPSGRRLALLGDSPSGDGDEGYPCMGGSDEDDLCPLSNGSSSNDVELLCVLSSGGGVSWLR